MHEEMIEYIRAQKSSVTSRELAEKFLKFKNPPENIAYAAIYGILSRDVRCYQDQDKNWFVRETVVSSQEDITLENLPLSAVHIVRNPAKNDEILYLAIWDLFPKVTLIKSWWMSDTSNLASEDIEIIMHGPGETFNKSLLGDFIAGIVEILNHKIPIFISNNERKTLVNLCDQNNEFLTDDTMLCSELLKAASIKIPRPLTLESLRFALIEKGHVSSDTYRQGEIFCEILIELIERLKSSGIRTRENIENSIKSEAMDFFKDKTFSYEDIAKQPSGPGVYGFKNKDGTYIYIGKSKNLRSRLLSYFRKSSESPDKLDSIRNDTYSFEAYQCGSELESLIYEYRLIKKYSPTLNNKIDVGERKGQFKQIDDCILILPHSNPDKCMTFWFKKGQKILIKPLSINWSANTEILKDLDQFFFTDKLSANNSDFPELEIAWRWYRKNEQNLIIVPVNRLSNSNEIFQSIKTYWKELGEKEI